MSESFADSLTLDQMRTFDAVARTGTFSAAARGLQRSQAAVSYQIANLEEQLEVALFVRTRRRPLLTEEGRAMLVVVRDVLVAVDQVRQRARMLGAGVEPIVRLGIDVLYPADLLAERLLEFKAEFSSVDVDLQMGVRDQLARSLNDGTADLIVGPLVDSAEARVCHEVELIAVAGPEHPLARSSDIVSSAVLKGHLHLVLADDDRGTASPVSGTWRLNDSAARRDLIVAGLGWGRVARHQVEHDLAAGRLVEIPTGQPIVVQLYVAHRLSASLGPATTWWFDAL